MEGRDHHELTSVRVAARCAVFAVALLLVPWRAGAQPLDDFDHLRTSFPLNGAHERIPCESCHVQGVFQGTPHECGVCHSGGGLWQATRKPMDHIPTSERCGDCHITTSWSVVRFDHAGIAHGCMQCHNGMTATGKPGDHPPSSNDCELCHRTVAWIPAGFDHSGVTGACYSCHNGTTATGKDSDHPPSGNDCEQCHRTTAWRPAGFDHSGITTGCFSCHGGGTARGKPGDHPPSGNDCELCHRTTAWEPAIFDHATVTPGSCSGCHGVTATGKPSGHFVTSAECDVCHATNGWTPILFTHSSAGYVDHGRRVDCQDCHRGNSETINWQAPAYQPDCAGCHAGDFESGPHKKTESPETRYTVSELRDCTGACHVYKNGAIEKFRQGEHRATGGDW